MSKYTIREIEQAMQPELSLDQLKEDGFEQGDNGSESERIINSLELEYAIRRLPEKEREIIKRISEGYTYKEIRKELKIRMSKIRETLDKLRDIMKMGE